MQTQPYLSESKIEKIPYCHLSRTGYFQQDKPQGPRPDGVNVYRLSQDFYGILATMLLGRF